MKTLQYSDPEKWVSIKDELPPNNVAVLVTGKGISVDIGWKPDFKNYQWCRYHGGEVYSNRNMVVTHWMFLPHPPITDISIKRDNKINELLT